MTDFKRKTLDRAARESEDFEARWKRVVVEEEDEPARGPLLAEIADWLQDCVEQGRYIPLGTADRRAFRSLIERWSSRLGQQGVRCEDFDELTDFDPKAGIVLEVDCPYPGLDPYDEARRASFFGREDLIDDCVAHLEQAGNRILLIIGASGSGKSSLALAGILPQLAVRHPEWLFPTRMTPGARPLAALAAAVAGAIGQPGRADEIHRRLAAGPDRALEALAEWCGQRLIALFVDQFEELLTLCRDGAEQGAFARALCALSDPAASAGAFICRILITLRTDHLARFENNDALKPLHMRLIGEGNQRHLSAIGFTEIHRAIKEPADRVGLRFIPPDLIDRLASQTAGLANGLPLLQFALQRLWATRPGSEEGKPLDLITEEMVGRLPDVERALGTVAKQVFERFGADQRKVCERLLLELVVLDENFEEPLRRRRSENEITAILRALFPGADVAKVVRVLVDEGLLRRFPPGDPGPATQIEVAHEALLRNWEHIRDKLNGAEVKERLHLVKQIGRDAEEWDRLDRRNDRLRLSGEPLERARQYAADRWIAEEVAKDYVAACGRRERRSQWLKWGASIATVAFLLTLWILREQQQRQEQELKQIELKLAQERADIAFAPELARQALNNPDPRLKLLFGVESLWRTGSADAVAAILEAWDDPAMQLSAPSALGSAGDVVTARFSPDAIHVALGRENGEVDIYQVASDAAAERSGGPPRERARLSHGHRISQLAFSSDGGHLAVASFGGAVSVWTADKASGYRRVATIDTSTYFKSEPRLNAIAISVGAKALLTVHRDGRGLLWDLASGKVRSTFRVADPAAAVAFSEKSERYFLTVESASCVPRIGAWDGSKPDAVRLSRTPIHAPAGASAKNGDVEAERCREGEGPLTSATISGDGRWVATANKVGVRRIRILPYRVWTETAARPEREPSAEQTGRPPRAREDAGPAVDHANEWEKATAGSLGGVGWSQPVTGARFVDLSASGMHLVSIASDERNLALKVFDQAERASMRLTPGAHAGVTVSPRGDLLVVVQDGGARLWKVGPPDTRPSVAIRPFKMSGLPALVEADAKAALPRTGASAPPPPAERTRATAGGIPTPMTPLGTAGEPDRGIPPRFEVLVATLRQPGGRPVIATAARGQPALVTLDGGDGREISRQAAASGVRVLVSSPRGDFVGVATLAPDSPREGAREPLSGIEIWAVEGDGKLEERSCRAQLKAATVSRLLLADGGIAAVLTADGKARLLKRSATDAGCMMTERVVSGTKAGLLALSPDGKWLALVSTDGEEFELWNTEWETMIRRTEPDFRPHGQDLVTQLGFSRDSSLLATGGSDGQVQLWQWKSASPTNAIALERFGVPRKVRGPIKHLAFGGAADGAVKWLAIVGSLDPDVVRVERLGSDAERSIKINLRGESSAQSIDFSPDGKRLVAAGQDGAVRVWTLPDGREIWRWTPGRSASGWLSQVGFVGPTRVAGVIEDYTVVVFDSDPHELKKDVDTFLTQRPELTLTGEEWRANVDPRGDHPFKRLVPRAVPAGETPPRRSTDKQRQEMVMFAIKAHANEARAVMRSTPAVPSLEGRSVATAAIGIGSLALKLPEVFKGHEQARDDPEAFARKVDGLRQHLSGFLQELDEIDRDQRLGPARLSEVYRRWDLWPQCGSCHPPR